MIQLINNPIFLLIGAFLISLLVSYGVMPVIIRVACLKGLVDKPGERTSHSNIIPTLGGLGIFIGFILSLSLFTNFKTFPSLQYFMFAMLVSFFFGMKDDIIALDPIKKMAGLFVAVTVLVVLGDVRITSFYMIFGIGELPYLISVLFSILVFLTIVNAVNLIDGVNGLCSSTSIISGIAFGIWFFLEGSAISIQLSILSAALVGALIGFLRFNITPARIFMGDTGSLLLGVILAFLAIEFVEINRVHVGDYKINNSPVVAMGFIALPLVDMLKVFVIRLSKKKSPFVADRKHIHHLLLDMGLNHTQTTIILSLLSVLFILFALALQNMRARTFGMLIMFTPLLVVCIPNLILKMKNKRECAE